MQLCKIKLIFLLIYNDVKNLVVFAPYMFGKT
jgi:hypothetical protein